MHCFSVPRGVPKGFLVAPPSSTNPLSHTPFPVLPFSQLCCILPLTCACSPTGMLFLTCTFSYLRHLPAMSSTSLLSHPEPQFLAPIRNHAAAQQLYRKGRLCLFQQLRLMIDTSRETSSYARKFCVQSWCCSNFDGNNQKTIPSFHHTSSQFCKARRFGRVAPSHFQVSYLKMAGATRPKRRALQNWLLVW